MGLEFTPVTGSKKTVPRINPNRQIPTDGRSVPVREYKNVIDRILYLTTACSQCLPHDPAGCSHFLHKNVFHSSYQASECWTGWVADDRQFHLVEEIPPLLW